jgi:hypothetical protein
MQWSYPLWSFKVGYEVLRDAPTYAEQQKLLAFFNSHAGRYQSFFFYDPSDNTVSGQQFGTGDGSTRTFQLNRSITGGSLSFTEPVKALINPIVTVNGTLMGAPITTNLALYSQQFDNAAWTFLANATVTPNSTAAPDGTTTADTLVRTATGNHFIGQPVTGTFASKTLTFSVWLRAGTLTGNIVLRIRDGGSTEYGNAVVTPTSTWTRYTVTGTFPGGAAANCYFYIDPANDTGSAGDTLFMWGAQLEIGSSATTYVPTTSSGGDYTIGSLGQITFNSAPASSAILTWSGQFMFLVRFDQDDLDVQQMMQGLWSASGIQLIGVKS